MNKMLNHFVLQFFQIEVFESYKAAVLIGHVLMFSKPKC